MSSEATDMGDGREWIALDKIISGACHWAPHLPTDLTNNGNQITLKLCQFNNSCGYTEEIHQRLFARRNRSRRAEIELLGIIFPNAKGQYKDKKIQFVYTENPPNLYNRFNSKHSISEPLVVAPILVPDNRYVQDLRGKEKVVIKAGNNKRVSFYKINNTNGGISNWTNFRHKCLWCRLRSRDWKNNQVNNGPLFTIESMRDSYHQLSFMHHTVQTDHAQYCAQNNITEDEELHRYDNKDDFIRGYVQESGALGMEGLELLLTCIPVERYLGPPLHAILGIGNNILDKVNAFIEQHLESMDDANVPMHSAFYGMLDTGFNVVREKYHSGALVGGDIHRLLANHQEIVDRAILIFKNPQLHKPTVAPNIDVLIDAFEKLCRGFGVMWRKFFPGTNITPKLHMVETHLPVQMRQFGCLGDKIEAAVERLHHESNKFHRMFSPMTNWAQKHAHMNDRREQRDVAAVNLALEHVRNTSKRLFSPEAQARRQASSEVKSETKRAKVSDAM